MHCTHPCPSILCPRLCSIALPIFPEVLAGHACPHSSTQPVPSALSTPCSVTLSIFPGVLAEDVHSAELGSWYPVALLTVFNLGDWAGKSVPALPVLRLRWVLPAWAALRQLQQAGLLAASLPCSSSGAAG